MKTNRELDKLDSELDLLHHKIESYKHILHKMEADIALLKGIKASFEDNVSVLTDPNIVASITEYKKTVENLQTAKKRLYALQIDFKNNTLALERAQKEFLETKGKYDILLEISASKVIRGRFGKK